MLLLLLSRRELRIFQKLPASEPKKSFVTYRSARVTCSASTRHEECTSRSIHAHRGPVQNTTALTSEHYLHGKNRRHKQEQQHRQQKGETSRRTRTLLTNDDDNDNNNNKERIFTKIIRSGSCVLFRGEKGTTPQRHDTTGASEQAGNKIERNWTQRETSDKTEACLIS